MSAGELLGKLDSKRCPSSYFINEKTELIRAGTDHPGKH